MSILICGALHLDTIVYADRMPRADETLMGSRVEYALGGKGGNQALAAAKLGGIVKFSGCVGRDDAGSHILSELREYGVDLKSVKTVEAPTGMSVAVVRPDGQYGAIVVSSANLEIRPQDISISKRIKVVLLQNEVRSEVNRYVARVARRKGATVILNAAPSRHFDEALYSQVDMVIANELEANVMRESLGPAGSGKRGFEHLFELGVEYVIETKGSRGAKLTSAVECQRMHAFVVDLVSAHGAGDMFAGALATRISEGADIVEAARFGQAAAATHVSASTCERRRINRFTVEELLRS